MDLPLPASLARASVQAHRDPDGYTRLYELALRDQWSLSVLRWEDVALGEVPASLRRAAADLFTQLHHGELTAMLVSAKLLGQLPDGARDVCATQVNDEARHHRFFAQLLARLGAEATVRPPVLRVMEDVYRSERPEALMLGMQLMIEGVAHSFFVEGARVFTSLDATGPLPPGFAGVRALIVEWLPQLLSRDESRHIALGLAYLRARIPALAARERHALEDDVSRWGAMVVESARDPDLIDNLGLDGDALSRRCIDDLNLRLAQVGLDTRIPLP